MERFLYDRPIKKNPKINALFAFPAIENFAMSSLGYLSIFKQLDLMEDVYVERYYSNSKTTQIMIEDIDIVGFSISFEMDIFQVIKMLEKLNIPLFARDRNESHPIVFAGGPVLTSNPLPYQEFFDFVNIGDSNIENVFSELVKNPNLSRTQRLDVISSISGVWCPKNGAEHNIVPTVERINEPACTPILSDTCYFKDTFIVEIARGCPKMCNFCLASWHNLPFRTVAVDKIISSIDFALQYTNKIALLGAYVAGHPDFDKILAHISDKNKENPIELSISSLRADLTDEKTVETLVECGAKTATIAIEAGSERLRKLINKDLSDNDILRTYDIAQSAGLKGIKAYMMIGHPTETQEDIEAIVSLMEKIKKAHKGFEVSLSINTFIPKPHTPFECVKREDKKSLEKKINYLKKHLHIIGVKTAFSSVDWDGVQSLISRYDAPMGEYLIDVLNAGGNLGAFKTAWRNYSKKHKLPKYEEIVNYPMLNALSDNTFKWAFLHSNNRQTLVCAQEKFKKSI
ncbi:radical SAM protein [bacterium]|nr:radical SAM protein [bacterium]